MGSLERLQGRFEGLVDSLGEGWEWLRRRGASALTRFRRVEREGAGASSSTPEAESWGLLAGDVAGTEDEVIVRVEAPGLESKDFSVSVTGRELLVRGEKRFEREEQDAYYHVRETAYGAFERVFALPCAVDVDRARARYQNGVLTVRLPRVEKKPRRRIHVKSS